MAIVAAEAAIAEDGVVEEEDIETELDDLDIFLTLALARDIVCNHGTDGRGGHGRHTMRALSSHEPSNSDTGCDKRTQNRHDVFDLQTGERWPLDDG